MAMWHDHDQLLCEARSGDLLSLQKLLTRHHARLVRRVHGHIPPSARSMLEPEDVCQETYAIVARDLGSFQSSGPDSFFAWLSTIADRRRIDLLRGLHARKRGGGLARVRRPNAYESTVHLLEHLAADSHTPSRSIARAELASAVASALDDLPGEQGQALRMRFVEGLTLEDTASRLGRSAGAVVMLCQRGVRRLSGVLGHLVQEPVVRGNGG